MPRWDVPYGTPNVGLQSKPPFAFWIYINSYPRRAKEESRLAQEPSFGQADACNFVGTRPLCFFESYVSIILFNVIDLMINELSPSLLLRCFIYLDDHVIRGRDQLKCILISAARPAETLSLKWNPSLSKWQCFVCKKRGKRIVRYFSDPFPNESPILPSDHLSGRSINRLFHRHFNISPRGYRHKLASHLFNNVPSESYLQAAFYHSSFDITRLYIDQFEYPVDYILGKL